MKLDPGMHIGMHLVFFGKSGVTCAERRGPTLGKDVDPGLPRSTGLCREPAGIGTGTFAEGPTTLSAKK
jgi:hypothetical protein